MRLNVYGSCRSGASGRRHIHTALVPLAVADTRMLNEAARLELVALPDGSASGQSRAGVQVFPPTCRAIRSKPPRGRAWPALLDRVAIGGHRIRQP